MTRPSFWFDTPEQFGGLLLDLRQMRGLTQRQVCALMVSDMDPTHMGTYERGKVLPNLARAIDLLGAHGYVFMVVPREDLVTE